MKNIISLILFTLIINVSINGQEQIDSVLNEAIKKQVQIKVGHLTEKIRQMADKQTRIEIRKRIKTEALNLFVEKGNAYYEEGIRKDGVTMQTTSLFRKKTSMILIRNYFDRVINYNYSAVDISSTKFNCIEVSDLKPIGKNRYVCTACWEQAFLGYRDGVAVYGDRTRKNVRVYITIVETATGRDNIIIQLGDVTAKETRSY